MGYLVVEEKLTNKFMVYYLPIFMIDNYQKILLKFSAN